MTENYTVLIVDDNPNNLEVLRDILEHEGMNVRPALSGEIALRSLESFTPELILLDIRMPGINGYETCRQIKDNARTRDIPVIFISALQDVDDKLKAFQAGGVDYVTKPFQAVEIVARAKTHIQLYRIKQNLEQLVNERTQALVQSEARYRVLFEDSPLAVIVFDVGTGLILNTNTSCSRLLGYAVGMMLGQEVASFVERGQREYLRNLSVNLPQHSEEVAYTGLLHLYHEDGHVLRTEGIVHHIDYPGHRAQILMLQDVTARRQAEESLQQAAKEHQMQLTHRALFDQLTGLPSRMLLGEHMRQGIEHCRTSGKRMAVCYIDLDDFGKINEEHGRHQGDNLLIGAAECMRSCLRGGDTLARIGSDEFALVLRGLDEDEELDAVMACVQAHLAQPFIADDFTATLTASIGITIYPQDGADADTLLRHADQAMMEAKQHGKGQIQFFDPEIDKRIRAQQETISLMRGALARREFVLYYQPKVDMSQSLVVGAEALIRWQHPERGLLPPGVFLPVIEEDLFMIELSEWVIAEALAQMARWRAIGLDLAVSVNISALHLLQPNFVERLQTLLAAQADTPGSRLEIEVLETSELNNMHQVQKVVAACQDMGVGFSLDDFGTGYSSLTYLRQLSVDTVKIDQSFVRNMLEVSEDLAIISSVIGLAAAFKRNVVAEGVETVAHGKLLLELGCNLAQGYGIARPMPGEDIPGWAGRWPDAAWLEVAA